MDAFQFHADPHPLKDDQYNCNCLSDTKAQIAKHLNEKPMIKTANVIVRVGNFEVHVVKNES